MTGELRMAGAAARGPEVSVRAPGTTTIGIVGCGYVADFYMATLANHPELTVKGVYDRDADRLATFSSYHGVEAYGDLNGLLSDPDVEMVLNLTNPGSHYDVSLAALLADKHVYSEKPLTLDLDEARHLVEVAGTRRLSLMAAPATYDGEAARAAAAVIAGGEIGAVRLVYAELDDGMVFRAGCEDWRSASGAPWPVGDEFEIGCTLQHASYYVSWLCRLFGPVRSVTAFASRQFDDKGTGGAPESLADDFSVSCLTFGGGVVARLTCGLIAPRDRSMRVFGEDGMLVVKDGWDTRSLVYLESYPRPAAGLGLSRLWDSGLRRLPGWTRRRAVAFDRPRYAVPVGHPGRLDYARGPALQAAALREGAWLDHGAAFTLHVTEVTLMMAQSRTAPMGSRTSTAF